MSRGARPERVRDLVRVVVLAAVALAPWAFGAVHWQAYVPLLVVSYAAGAFAWARGHWGRAHGESVRPIQGLWLLGALALLGLLQLVPIPVGLLRVVSPGSFAHYDYLSLGPLQGWRPISVDPAATHRALLFLIGFTLLYAYTCRELASRRWRRRTVVVIVANGLLLTIEALIQATSAEPSRLLGLYKPTWDWATFGPYVNKNHFAGYIAMALPLALAWALDAFSDLRHAWRRRRGWLAIGDPVGTDTLRRGAVALALIVGLVASRSRGGLMAVAIAALVAPLLARRRAVAALAVGLLIGAAVFLRGLDDLQAGAQRGAGDIRFEIWRDVVAAVPRFPVLGSGLNTFPMAFALHRTQRLPVWVGDVNEAHNDYLQAFFEGGAIGGLAVIAAVLLLLKSAARTAPSGPLRAGLLGCVVASCAHALVDFNWQIPANAATFALLSGLAIQPLDGDRLDPPDTRP